jgi:hypothetical protein
LIDFVINRTHFWGIILITLTSHAIDFELKYESLIEESIWTENRGLVWVNDAATLTHDQCIAYC